jgi:hypothetical protein
MKKRKKALRAGMLAILLSASFAAGAAADDTLKKVEAYLRPDFKVELDGYRVVTDPPLIYNGSSYLPFRQIANMLGAEVDWDETTYTIKLKRPPAPNSGSGTQGNQGSGTGTKPGTGSSSPAVPDDLKVEDEIVLDRLMRYNFIYDGKTYPVLANFYQDAMYVRWSDVKKMPFDFGKPKLTKEKRTGEDYVHMELVKPAMMGQVRGEAREYAIVDEGTMEESKLKALNEYFGQLETGYTIRPLKEENTYEALAQTKSGQYRKYNLRFTQRYDGGWSIASMGWTTYPDD